VKKLAPLGLGKNLRKILGPDRVRSDRTNRYLYCRDMMTGSALEMKAGRRPCLPDLICSPDSTDEVAAIVRIASRAKIPVIPFGAGSGVSGGTLPIHGGILIDLKRMARIGPIEGNPMASPYRMSPYTVVAESGMLGMTLERRLNEQGFTLGHFPSSILCATLGGYLAARSAGQCSSKYGKIEDMVTDIEAVLPTGEVIPIGKPIPAFRRTAAKEILVGSEGTLGIITKARLKVHPLPPVTRYRGVTFNRLESGLQAMREIMQSGLRPSVIRLYDPLDSLLLQFGYESEGVKKKLGGPFGKIRLFHAVLKHPHLLQTLFEFLPAELLLILGFEGEAGVVKAQESVALKICQRSIARDQGEGPGLHWLKHRYSVSFKMPELFHQDCFVDTIEVASTWDLLGPLYETMHRLLKRRCLVLAHFSHAYPEGCSIYFTVIGRTGSAEKDCVTYREIWREAMEECLKAGGTISHHHGIGLLKSSFLPRELGEGGIAFLRQIKKKLDPHGIMNPGKLAL